MSADERLSLRCLELQQELERQQAENDRLRRRCELMEFEIQRQQDKP